MHTQLSDAQAWADPAVMGKVVLFSGHLTPTSAGVAEAMAGRAEQADQADHQKSRTCFTHGFNHGRVH